MSDYPTQPCRSCRKPVIWVLTDASRARMPVDPTPSPRGNLELRDDDTEEPPIIARVVPLIEREGRVDLHTSHFDSCPNADAHRRRRPRPTRRAVRL